MDILLTSTVLAALITSLVNLRLAAITTRNAKDLEKFKQDLGLEVAKQLELTKAKLRSDEIAFTRLWELRAYLKTNNITSLAKAAGPINDDSFTRLCVNDLPTLFMEYGRRIDECSVYLRVERLEQIKQAANIVREAMQALIKSPQLGAKECANRMITEFSNYNTTVEKQIDDALAHGLDNLRR